MNPSPQTLVIPVDEYAQAIENEFGQLLLPPQSGIYSRHNNTPKRYFQMINGEVRYLQSVTQIDPALSVCAEDGQTFSPSALKYSHPLADQPVVSPAAIRMVAQYAEIQIDQCIAWIPGRRQLHDVFPLNLHPDLDVRSDLYTTFEERVRVLLMELTQDIMRFINGQVWNIYLVSVRGMNLVIENKGDYRIDEWTRLKSEGRI